MTAPPKPTPNTSPGWSTTLCSPATSNPTSSPKRSPAFPLHPGVKLIRPHLPNADDEPTRSTMEDTFLAFCEQFGFPRPQINRHAAGHRVDAIFREERVIVELDSWRFHNSRQAFETDRNRDADALARGFITLRMTWSRLTTGAESEARRLQKILEQRRPRG